ncbi:MAG: OsmC family protein [Bryobacteraceae bacterium]
MEVLADYLGGTKFAAEARGHRVICDQPRDNGGTDEGMSPPEFLLASLATCAAYYAVQYLQVRGLPARGVKVRVNAEKAQQPARLASFQIEVEVPHLDNRHHASVLRAVKACLIHNTLLSFPRIEVSIHAAPASVAVTVPPEPAAIMDLGSGYRN